MYDVAVIGGGAGGLTIAAGAAQLGLKVILFEANALGGDCLHHGCVPSKALISAAKSFHGLRTSAFATNPPNSIPFNKVTEHIKQTKDTIGQHDSIERFSKLGVTVIIGHATFQDEKTISCNDRLYTAKKMVIATGSKPRIPEIPGLESVPYYTNETIFDLPSLPEELLIIGGGPIGCELGSAFALMGSHVTILEPGYLLKREEPQAVQHLRCSLAALGMTIHEQVQDLAIDEQNNKITTSMVQQNLPLTLTGSHLLVATGRMPHLDLGLDAAGIVHGDNGIDVNQYLQTNQKHIYAIGDVTGLGQFTHLANSHAQTVLKQLAFRLPAKRIASHELPRVIYSYPEIAHLGYTSTMLDAKNISFDTVQMNFQENDRWQTTYPHRPGYIQLFIDKRARLLGVSIVGEGAGELISNWCIPLKNKTKIRKLAQSTLPYPSFAELNKQVAGKYFGPKLFSPKVRRLVRFLFKLPG